MNATKQDLIHEIARLKQAMQHAVSGMDLAYDSAAKKFTDETLLHIGHHRAALAKALADSCNFR
jgi:hypothetical protein